MFSQTRIKNAENIFLPIKKSEKKFSYCNTQFCPKKIFLLENDVLLYIKQIELVKIYKK